MCTLFVLQEERLRLEKMQQQVEEGELLVDKWVHVRPVLLRQYPVIEHQVFLDAALIAPVKTNTLSTHLVDLAQQQFLLLQHEVTQF